MNWKVKVFVALMLGHWAEHIVQAYQVWVLHMPRHCALGLLGMKYPWLVRTEAMHFGYALFTMIGVVWLWKIYGYSGWWKAAFWISLWHTFEHTLLFIQAQSHPWFGRSEPTSLIQLFWPRIELHLFYNSLATIPMIVAMWQHHRRSHERSGSTGSVSVAEQV